MAHCVEKGRGWRALGGVLALLGVLLCAGGALAATEAGRVISLSPEAWAERDGARLELALKTPLLVKDVVQTDVVGRAQILFMDDTTVSVAPNTRISLSDFVFDEGGKDSFAMDVASGVSRVVTGLIVKNNPNGFRVTTPHATIGIRGTDLTIVSTPDQTSVIINQVGPGGVEITNTGTGQKTLHHTPNTTVDVGPRGNSEYPSTPGEGGLGRDVSRSNTNQNLVAGSDAPLLDTFGVPVPDSGDNPVNDNLTTVYTPATLSGHFAGNLAGSSISAIGNLPAAVLGGTYTLDVVLGSGSVSAASMNVTDNANNEQVFSGQGGSGAINANGLTFAAGGWTTSSWNTASGSLGSVLRLLNTTPTLNGQFDAATGQLYDNVTAGFERGVFTPQALFGAYSGSLAGQNVVLVGSIGETYGGTLTGTYAFAVELGSGAVSNAALSISDTDMTTTNQVIWTGTGGSGAIAAGTLAFAAAGWTNNPTWDNNSASGISYYLANNNPSLTPTLRGAFDATTGKPSSTAFLYSPTDISGHFSDGLYEPGLGGGTVNGTYSFDVALGSARLSNVEFTTTGATTSLTFSGGSGAIGSNLDFSVSNFTTVPTTGQTGTLYGDFNAFTGQPNQVSATVTP